MKVLIIGSGMYVCGRDTPNYDGTIGPALLEAFKLNLITSIDIYARSLQSAKNACNTLNALQKLMNTACKITSISSLENVNSDDYDCAIICTPDHLHAHYAILLAKRGLHLLVVKPMATSTEEGISMIKAVQSAGVIGRIEYHKRYDESNICLKNSIQNNDLGILQNAYIEYSQRKSIPENKFRSWCDKTNIFQYLGTHYVDLLYWATGYKPLSVTTFGQADYLANKLGVNIYDSMQVIIQWERDDKMEFTSIHNTSWIDPETSSAMSNQKIKIFGTKGSFDADQKNRGITVNTDCIGTEHINPYFSRRFVNSNSNTFFKGYGIDSIIDFIQDCYSFRYNSMSANLLNIGKCTFEEGLISVKVVEAATQSLKQKTSVKIK